MCANRVGRMLNFLVALWPYLLIPQGPPLSSHVQLQTEGSLFIMFPVCVVLGLVGMGWGVYIQKVRFKLKKHGFRFLQQLAHYHT